MGDMTGPAFAPPPDWKGLGVITTYEDLLNVLRARAILRHITVGGEDTAEVAGLPIGYVQKIIGPRPVRRIGMMSLGPILSILGVKLIMVEDADALKRYGSRLKKRDERLVRAGLRAGSLQVTFSSRAIRKIRSEGGKARMEKLGEEGRKELSRRANEVRWKRLREAKASGRKAATP
jgi:hypothetical protein